MNSGKTVFAQLMNFVPAYEFALCVEHHDGHRKVQTFSCWDQFLCMAFAQLTWRESLRDIEATLRAAPWRLYHMGIRGGVSRNTLANANAVRDWRIYEDLARKLIATARRLYADEPIGVALGHVVYALDSTTIDLCLALFPWAGFRKRKGAIKLHTLLDVRGSIPTVVIITSGKVHDVNILDRLVFEAGAIYVADRGYVDFARLHRIARASAFFVTRAKKNLDFRRCGRRPVDKATGLRSDQDIVLAGPLVRHDYPDKLRRVSYCDPDSAKRLVFLTNNFALPALAIAQIYRSRWKVELFFKWIKQHLRIKAFYGTSENAVKTQIWIAISVYVLIAIIKKSLGLRPSLYTILQVLSVALFEKIPIIQAFSDESPQNEDEGPYRQLNLFD
jgi:hypothetical protein